MTLYRAVSADEYKDFMLDENFRTAKNTLEAKRFFKREIAVLEFVKVAFKRTYRPPYKHILIIDVGRPSFAFNTEKHYSGEIKLIDRSELRPGQTSKAYIKLLPAKTIRKNLKPTDAFSITEGNKTIGIGIIEEVKHA